MTVGTEVRYSTRFLKAILTPPMDAIWRATGFIQEISPEVPGLVMVNWSGQLYGSYIHESALEPAAFGNHATKEGPEAVIYAKVYGTSCAPLGDGESACQEDLFNPPVVSPLLLPVTLAGATKAVIAKRVAAVQAGISALSTELTTLMGLLLAEEAKP